MNPSPIKSLYLCYFGLREPLVQTQVLPYLRQLVRDDVRVSLLTFESDPRTSWDPASTRDWRERLEAEGIRWHSLPYHKRPSLPATAYDILVGALFAAGLSRREKFDVFHGRAHVAAAMGMLARRMAGGRLVFDIRGFNAEEYVDAGRWRAGGLKFRLTKAAERAVLKAADGFVVLTERARDILFPGCTDTDQEGRPVEVIPCCVDLERFRASASASRDQVRDELGVTGRRVIAYVGALGGWYMAEEMAEFVATARERDPATFALFLTQGPAEMIAGPLLARGVPARDFLVRQVPPDDVPRHLRAADLAISFIRPCYSKISSSPTKLAEYLAAGLPVVCSAGIGDTEEVVEGDRVGVVLREFGREAYGDALDAVEGLLREEGLAERCRESAERRFDLDGVGGAGYRRLYRRIFEPSRVESPASR